MIHWYSVVKSPDYGPDTSLNDVSPQCFYQGGVIMSSTVHNGQFTLGKCERISKISIQLMYKNISQY